jgi:hypothetical protein
MTVRDDALAFADRLEAHESLSLGDDWWGALTIRRLVDENDQLRAEMQDAITELRGANAEIDMLRADAETGDSE